MPRAKSDDRRPRLAMPFSVLIDGDAVWLVAGEDVRYSLGGQGLAGWLPGLLEKCDGTRSIDSLVAGLSAEQRSEGREVFELLYGERLVGNGTSQAAHRPARTTWQTTGQGEVFELLGAGEPGPSAVTVLAQDSLDYQSALAFNREKLAGGEPWMWISTGPSARAYLGPLFLPDAGPCLECLVQHFQMLSPEPRLYTLLATQGDSLKPSSFPPLGAALVSSLARWKLDLVDQDPSPSALFDLHVISASSLEVTAHAVLCNPECPACNRYGALDHG